MIVHGPLIGGELVCCGRPLEEAEAGIVTADPEAVTCFVAKSLADLHWFQLGEKILNLLKLEGWA